MSLSSNKNPHHVVVKRPDGRLKVSLKIPEEEGKTKGSFKDECDINNIMRKYKATGQLPTLAQGDPKFGNFADVPTFQEALDLVHKAEMQFAALPAEVRRDCYNDPAIFLDKVQDRSWVEKNKLALPKASDAGKVVPGATGAASAAPGGGASGGTPVEGGGAKASGK